MAWYHVIMVLRSSYNKGFHIRADSDRKEESEWEYSLEFSEDFKEAFICPDNVMGKHIRSLILDLRGD